MLSRRNFIKTAAAIVADSFLPTTSFAEDFSSNGSEIYRPTYQYNPFEQQQHTPSRAVIQNNILPMDNGQQKSFWDMPRKILLRRVDTREQAQLVYFANGRVNQQDYHNASYLLRDVKQNKMVYMDIKLLDLICAVQAWLNHYGVNSPIMIHSGFRTAQTNGGLEGAAKNSMHLYGRAIDFSVPGLSPVILAKIAAQFKAGGIGIYPSRNFIHLDTGGVRVWMK